MAERKQLDVLPRSLPPIGINREQAANFIGVSISLFDEMVGDGRMPKPKRINARLVWDRRSVERAFAKLPGGDSEESENDWETAV